jgi:hypothetical protein
MPGTSEIARGNIALAMILQSTQSLAIVAANTTAEQTFILNGIQIGDLVAITKTTAQAGLGIVNSRVSAANTVAITFANATGVGITPTVGDVYVIELNRPTNLPLPTAIT